jgi:voltage-gated potassium channel
MPTARSFRETGDLPDENGVPDATNPPSSMPAWKQRLYIVIFRTDTAAGKIFDVLLLIFISLSVVAVLLESVSPIKQQYGQLLYAAEWFFTIIFTIEYGLRLLCVRSRWKYACSFFGVVDLLAILPTYISLLIPGAHPLLVVRSLRLLRVFRVFKLAQYTSEAQQLRLAMWASARKITVFLGVVLTLVLVIGAMMYLVEGPTHGFDSIPRSMYWGIVTLTTVGYGDISPQTPLGQALASVVMVIGYGIIAVPTGIVTVELADVKRHAAGPRRVCDHCGETDHTPRARFCAQCGEKLPDAPA